MGLVAHTVHGGRGAIGFGRARLALAHHVGRNVLFVMAGFQAMGHAANGPSRHPAAPYHFFSRRSRTVFEHQGLDVGFVGGGGLGRWQRQYFRAMSFFAAHHDEFWFLQQLGLCLDWQLAA